jgi:hypothetical protein
MKVKLILSTVLCLGPFLMGCGLSEVNGRYIMLQGTSQSSSSRSPFRYVIVHNDVTGEPSNPNDGYRYVEVLLDDNAFSERKLRELFNLVSRRFPTPRVLHVQVYTSLEDVETPEEREAGRISEAPDDPSADRYHRAFYLRDADGNEWFRYNPNPLSREIRTVILRGRDVQAPRR